MGKQELQFSLGEDAGKILTDIAREHLICSLDPQKAIETIMKSLIGCPKQLALDIIAGEYVILMDTDKQEFLVCKFDKEIHGKTFTRLDMADWSSKSFLKIQDDSLLFLDLLEKIRDDIFSNNGKFSIDIEYSKVISYFYDTNDDDFDLLEDNYEMTQLSELINATKKFINKSINAINVIKWMHSNYPGKINDAYTKMPCEVLQLSVELTNLVNGSADLDLPMTKTEEAYSRLDKFIKCELTAQEARKRSIAPVNILDKWSAGWLSPSGEYYALNGEIANMLHTKIADALFEDGIIDCGDPMNNPDSWLEENGWAKIHGDLVLYDGWNRGRYSSGKKVPMTQVQQDMIAKYGQVCCGGVLRLGLSNDHMSAARFGMTDIPMLRKYFEF